MDLKNNFTNNSEYIPYADRPETYIVPIIFALIFIIGVVGNGTLVLIFVKNPNMRNIPNCYIFSLALTDLLVIITCVPFTSILYTVESWPWGTAICKLSETSRDVSIGVSVFTLTALSAERYCAIANPLRKLQTQSLSVVITLSIWLFAIILAIPAAVMSHVETVHLYDEKYILICLSFPQEEPPDENDDADSGDSDRKYYVLAESLVYYVIPLCVIAVFYSLMARRLRASTRDMPAEMLSGLQSAAQARARQHVARMVLAFVVVFFVCFFPYYFVELWFHFNPNAKVEYDDFWHILRIIGWCLSFLNSCVNPVALYCVSGVFRQHFNRYLFRKANRRFPRSALCRGRHSETSCNNSTCRRATTQMTLVAQPPPPPPQQLTETADNSVFA